MESVRTYEHECRDEMLEVFPELTVLEAPPGLTRERQLQMYRKMLTIREFEIAVMELWRQNTIYGIAHSYEGSEAIAVGACAALGEQDLITSTHRGHGHVIAKGGDVSRMMAELMGKQAGYCHGKGGSMHIAAVDKGMLGATGIVGSGMPIAVGAGLSAQVLHKDHVTVCFHGDGGTNQGVWHESINLSAAWDLPVVFLCENNQWAISCSYDRAARNPNIADRAIGYGIPGVTVDGFNPFAVYGAVREAVGRARSGEGPSLVVAKCYRYIGHFVADDQHYRDLSMVAPWEKLDPIVRMGRYLIESGTAAEDEISAIQAEVRKVNEEAIEFGKRAAEPAPDQLYADLYAPDDLGGGANR